jgi:hypothetical protein
VLADAEHHLDVRGAELLHAEAFDVRVRIATADDDLRDLRREDRFRAGRRAAVVVAGLERDVECAALRFVARRLERRDLGVVAAGGLMMTRGDELAVLHDDGAHVRIRRRPTVARVDEGDVHPLLVVAGRRRRRRRAGRRRGDARGFLPGLGLAHDGGPPFSFAS